MKPPEYFHFRVKTDGLTITVEPMEEKAFELVRHGRWNEHIFDGIMGGRPRTNVCSMCLYTFPVRTNYCPNCGAKMGEADV